MAKLMKVNREEAIQVMENNLKIIKERTILDTFLILFYDLERGLSLGRNRLDNIKGRKLIYNSKTYVLNHDTEEDSVSILSIYSALQEDICHIMPIGEKHDMIIIPQLE